MQSRLCLLLCAALAGCRPPDLPPESRWLDLGTVLTAGAEGEWDHILWGAWTLSVVKKDGRFLLYYQGARNYSEAYGTVTYRTIGVASSEDGIRFTKHAANPVLDWSPRGGIEEGAVCGTAALDGGSVVMFYGANEEISATEVNASIRWASSVDGLHFEDHGVVLRHDDPSVWGFGDELFPIAAMRSDQDWLLFYTSNGTAHARTLGVARGTQPGKLTDTAAVRAGRRPVRAWGAGSVLQSPDGSQLLVLNDLGNFVMEARRLSLAAPHRLPLLARSYRLADAHQAAVFLDEASGTWLMYYRSADRIGLKVAPVGEPDHTPPGAPDLVSAAYTDQGAVEIRWQEAHDPDTGVANYRIFRNGLLIGTSLHPRFTDQSPRLATAVYRVRAVNRHGAEGPASLPASPER